MIAPLVATWEAQHPSVSGHQGRCSVREIVNVLWYQKDRLTLAGAIGPLHATDIRRPDADALASLS